MPWPPEKANLEGGITGKFKLALIDEDGTIIATKGMSFTDYSWPLLEYTFELKGHELARDYMHLKVPASG